MRNEQPPAPRVRGGDGLIAVHSMFYTLQGEGPLAGRPAVFVRLYGCNLQCPACDTDYTSKREQRGADALAERVLMLFEAPVRPLAVITGGEPFRQPLLAFVTALWRRGIDVQIETNGTLAPEPGDIWNHVQIVCSPKTGAVNKQLEPYIDAYKYIVRSGDVDADDGLPLHALEHPAAPRLARPHARMPASRIYVQPMDPDLGGINLQTCINSCYEFGYTLSLQQHKIIGVP